MLDTKTLLVKSVTDFPSIKRSVLQTLQVNLGYKCNLSCAHCHVNAGPKRTEMMDDQTLELLFEVVARLKPGYLDLTGGAPELHPQFKVLVARATTLGVQVIDRCNLTVLLEPGFEGMADFLAGQGVEIVASLPCYLEENVNQQRGKGVFDKSIEALRTLNSVGYGLESTGLRLNLVYNPVGPYLPPAQEGLETDYKRVLSEQYQVYFNQLFTLANMPIARFGATLMAKRQFNDYMTLLRDSYNAENLKHVMCRSTVSVDWQGYLYDCDFNQMLSMPLESDAAGRLHLQDLLHHNLEGRAVKVADHCFGCTAGQGSSCGGALIGDGAL